jgi:hypothetical protein
MSAVLDASLNWIFELHPALLLYLALGVLTLVVVGGAHLRHHRHGGLRSELLTSLMEDLHPERKKLWYRIRAQVLAPLLTVAAMVLFWPVAWWMKRAELRQERALMQPRDDEVFQIKRQHLLELLTAEEIEAREMVQDPLNAVPKVPFGHLNEVWRGLISGVQPGDELWSFSATWKGNYGSPELRKGYALWREGTSVSYFLTMCKELEPVWPELPVGKATETDARRADLPSDEFEIPAFLRKQAD